MDVGKKETTPRKWGGRRRFAAGLNVSASLVLAVGAFVMVNYLTHRYLHLRVDVSRSSFYELSGKTTEMLSKCDADIDVYVLFSRNEDETGCYSEIRNLLDEYRYFAGGVDTLGIEVMYVDPDVDGAKAKKLRQEFDLRDPQVVIFKNNRGGKSEVVPERHIVEYEYKPLDSGLRQERVKSVFRGEQVFSSAILRITEEKKPVVYSVRGHDEHDVGDYAMHVGYSDIAHAMYLDNVDLRSISLTEMQGIPADCDVLLIAGPTRAFHPAEVELIAQYLKSNTNL
jgi:hypothetical protein